jgi:hypothetical protein
MEMTEAIFTKSRTSRSALLVGCLLWSGVPFEQQAVPHWQFAPQQQCFFA